MQFSIIVPVYNVDKYLKKCLDSILTQTFCDFEVILIDDGSTDTSGAICDCYAQMDKRIKVFHQQNQGLSGARNTGLEHAAGNWIIFIDSDDWVDSNHLEILNRNIAKYVADVYCINYKKISEDETTELEKNLFFVESDIIYMNDEKKRFHYYENTLMQYKNGWEAWSRAFNRNLIEEFHLRFVSTKDVFAEDYLFTLQYFLHVKKICVICDCFYCYRQRSDSLLGTKNLDTIMNRLVKLNDLFYKDIILYKFRYFRKNYWRLYFHLMNYHIQYMFKDVPLNTIEQWLRNVPFEKQRSKSLKKIYKNGHEFRKYMVNHKWM